MWFPALTFNIDPTAIPFDIFALVTAWIFMPYYRAMWRYRRSGRMAKEATEDAVGFILDWVGPTKVKRPTWLGNLWRRK